MNDDFKNWAKTQGVDLISNPNQETEPLMRILEALYLEIQELKVK